MREPTDRELAERAAVAWEKFWRWVENRIREKRLARRDARIPLPSDRRRSARGAIVKETGRSNRRRGRLEAERNLSRRGVSM